MCSVDVDQTWDTWSDTWRKARKPHECNACWAPIAPGSLYVAHFNVMDGSPSAEKVCFPCAAIREVFGDAHAIVMAPSVLVEQLRDCIGTNDDEEDEWRPLLADVLKRRRVSAPRMRQLRKRWAEVAA